MLELTASKAPGAALRQGMLPELPFEDGSFDAALGSFVLNQVGDPTAALGEFYRVLASGGRIGVTLWPLPPTAMDDLWQGVLKDSCAVVPRDTPAPPQALRAMQTGPGLSAALSTAGFGQIRHEVIEWVHRVDAGQLWSGTAGGVTKVGAVLVQQTPEVFRAAKEAFSRLSAELLDDNGLVALPVSALIATGTRP
ncbi:MAG: hypothetical protein QG608_358 [Actinomycetota bacterium]|nr:hypothetical protein [Actinomycetota bacterium]